MPKLCTESSFSSSSSLTTLCLTVKDDWPVRSVRIGPAPYNAWLLVPAQNTWLGKRVLNNFTWFYHSHLLMFVIFYIAAILHPWPGTPGYSHEHHHSITWVRASRHHYHPYKHRNPCWAAQPGFSGQRSSIEPPAMLRRCLTNVK